MHLKTSNQKNISSLWKEEWNCSEDRLLSIAQDLGQALKAGDRVLLEGPMGVGKTTFAKGLLTSLQIVQSPAGSPTFAIAHEYQGSLGEVIHIDFYRLRSEEEIEDAGISAYYWERSAIVLSEWLSLWPRLEEKVLASGRSWKVNLSFDPENEASRVVKIEKA